MADTQSKQPRLAQTRDLVPYIWTMWEDAEDVPQWGSGGRLAKLREYARAEPIMAGAISSMLSKANSLDWTVEGGRNRVSRYQAVLAEAEDGQGWSYLLDRWLADYLIADIGGPLELARYGKNGPVGAIYNIDAECAQLTGNVNAPAKYYPKLTGGGLSGTAISLLPGDFLRIVDMPSADENKFGLGFSAVSRALKASKILMALYRYEDERLSDMPMPGLVSITGMTMDEVASAFALYNAKRESREQVVFKNVLWLASQASAINPIAVNLTSFAGLPEGFNKEQTITLYVYTLALDFGVDVREFWPASQTGATKAEAEVQAQKAKGKGFGRMLAAVERAINWHILPDGLEFKFDQKDSEDDLLRETIREKSLANIRRLWEPAATGEGIITTEEARRWLVEENMAPAWLYGTDKVTAYGNAPVEAQEESTTPTESAPVAPAAAEPVPAVIAEKAARADLDPGEDYVAVNRSGAVQTLWTARRTFAVNWPVSRSPVASPFSWATYP